MIIVIDVIERDSNVQLWLTQTLRGINVGAEQKKFTYIDIQS
jgi:hypothetical protein